MSEVRQQQTIPSQRQAEPQVTGWVGWIFFAGIMMATIGAVHAIAGLVGIFKEGYFLVPSSQLVITWNYTAWGWTNLILGVVVAAAGIGLFTGRMWARAIAVIFAMVSAIVNLVFIAAYPWWSIIAITLDVFVIYAVTVHGRETRVE